MTTWTGTAPTFVSGDTTTVPGNLNTLRDAVKAASEASTAYTPVWTGSTTNPVLNNGTLAGAYTQVGKWIRWRIVITCGSTTTYGSGFWIFTLPVAAHAIYSPGVPLAGSNGGGLLGSQAFPLGVLRYTSSTTVTLCTPAGNNVTPTTPFTWASGAILSLGGEYESA